MIGSKFDRDALHAFARSSFVPHTRRQAVAQCLSVAIERRAYNRDAITPFGLGWKDPQVRYERKLSANLFGDVADRTVEAFRLAFSLAG